jgi:TolB-like protein
MKHWVYAACAGLITLIGTVTTGGVTAMANPSVAIFPFELLDSSQEGELLLKVRPEETKRLELLTNELKSRLTASGQFQVASTEALATEIKAAAPLFKCNGCETDLAKMTGAKLAMLGLVQKFSDTLLAVNIQVIDAETGVLKNAYSAGVQGNTDEAWVRGVSYIIRNKLLSETSSK